MVVKGGAMQGGAGNGNQTHKGLGSQAQCVDFIYKHEENVILRRLVLHNWLLKKLQFIRFEGEKNVANIDQISVLKE